MKNNLTFNDLKIMDEILRNAQKGYNSPYKEVTYLRNKIAEIMDNIRVEV